MPASRNRRRTTTRILLASEEQAELSSNPLETDFERTRDYLVAIDSDGCAFDTMEIKHKECFIPNIVKHFELQAISKYVRETAEFVNLYSHWRGINRFPALIKTLDFLEERPEISARNVRLPKLEGLRDWIDRETRLGNPALLQAVDETGDEELQIALEWSIAVNETIDDMVHGVSPFPYVRECLDSLNNDVDMIVCSATPNAALFKEWNEHDIAQYVSAICGQEAGAKKETLNQAAEFGYEDDHILMIGDAPGDMNAAQSIGALFYPIIPGAEEESWQRLFQEAIETFLNGTYAGIYEQTLIDEFDQYLPNVPPWKDSEGNRK